MKVLIANDVTRYVPSGSAIRVRNRIVIDSFVYEHDLAGNRRMVQKLIGGVCVEEVAVGRQSE